MRSSIMGTLGRVVLLSAIFVLWVEGKEVGPRGEAWVIDSDKGWRLQRQGGVWRAEFEGKQACSLRSMVAENLEQARQQLATEVFRRQSPGPDLEVLKEGEFKTARGVPGYFVKFKSGAQEHWVAMLAFPEEGASVLVEQEGGSGVRGEDLFALMNRIRLGRSTDAEGHDAEEATRYGRMMGQVSDVRASQASPDMSGKKIVVMDPNGSMREIEATPVAARSAADSDPVEIAGKLGPEVYLESLKKGGQEAGPPDLAGSPQKDKVIAFAKEVVRVAEKHGDPNGVFVAKMNLVRLMALQGATRAASQELQNMYVQAASPEEREALIEISLQLLASAGKREPGYEFLDWQIRSQPDAVRWLGRKASFARLAGDPATVIDCFEKALILNPQDSDLRRELALQYLGGKRPADALACVEKNLQSGPRHEGDVHLRAQILSMMAMQDPARALAAASAIDEAVSTMDPVKERDRIVDSVAGKTLLLARSGKKAEAVASLQKLKELDLHHKSIPEIESFLGSIP